MPDIDYDAIARKYGGTPAGQPPAPSQAIDYNAIAAKHGGTAVDGRTWINEVLDFAVGMGSRMNPVTMVEGIRDMTLHPKDAIVGMLEAQGALLPKAEAAFKRGDWGRGVRHSIEYLIPILGPGLSEQGDKMISGKPGDMATGLGEATGDAVMTVLPFGRIARAAKRGLTPSVTSRVSGFAPLANPNPAEAAAFQMMEQEGIQIPAGTATGNSFVQSAQYVADSSAGGSTIAKSAQRKRVEKIQQLGNRLLDEHHPVPIFAEQAGESVDNTMTKKIIRLDQEADVEYKPFYDAHTVPANSRTVQMGFDEATQKPIMQAMSIPIDMRQIKVALQELHDDFVTWVEPANRNASRGFQAIRSIIDGPDYMTAKQAERGLGGLKSLAREGTYDNLGNAAEHMRSINQGMGANAVGLLQKEIDETVERIAGPDVLDSLRAGRAVTAFKHETADLTKAFRGNKAVPEHVQMYGRLVQSKDSGVALLREIANHAPGDMPKVARAFLEGLFEQATNEGGWAHAKSIFDKWHALGRGSKQILFPNPLQRERLDHFFLATKRLADNPNPSGTAIVTVQVSQAALVFKDPASGAVALISGALASKLLNSSKGVQLLQQGLRMPSGRTPAAIALGGKILSLIGEHAKEEEEQQ